MLIVYKIQQYYVHYEMLENINSYETDFQKITLSFNDYQKSKINENEIEIKGKMYDIKSINILNNKLELLVVNDSKEEQIIQKVKDFFNYSNQPKGKFSKQVSQLLSLNYISPKTESFIFWCFLLITIFISSKATIIISKDLDIPSLPPKLA